MLPQASICITDQKTGDGLLGKTPLLSEVTSGLRGKALVVKRGSLSKDLFNGARLLDACKLLRRPRGKGYAGPRGKIFQGLLKGFVLD